MTTISKAKLTVELEIDLADQTWNDDCTLGQVQRDAARAASNRVQQLFGGNVPGMRLLSQRVDTVLVPEKKR